MSQPRGSKSTPYSPAAKSAYVLPRFAAAEPETASIESIGSVSRPAASRSAGRTFRWTLPKRLKSITSQVIFPRSISGSAISTTASVVGSMGVPSCSIGMPEASEAAAGHSVSGARKDSACGRRTTSVEVSSTAERIPPAASQARESRPLSGPTRCRPLSVSIATSRSLPTFGSTTASTTELSWM